MQDMTTSHYGSYFFSLCPVLPSSQPGDKLVFTIAYPTICQRVNVWWWGSCTVDLKKQLHLSFSTSSKDSTWCLLWAQLHWTQILTLGFWKWSHNIMWRIIYSVKKSGSYNPYDHYNPNHYDFIVITPTSATVLQWNSCFRHICIRCIFGITERKKCELDTWSHCPESTPVQLSRNCMFIVGGADIFGLEVKLYVLVTIVRIHPIKNWVLKH